MLQLCLFSILIIFWKSASCQDIGEIHVSVGFLDMTRKQAIQNLEENYPVSFSYSDNILPKEKIKVLYLTDVPLSVVLDTLFYGFSVSYKQVGEQIVLYKHKKENSFYNLSGFIRDVSNGEILIGVSIYNKENHAGAISNAYGFYSIQLSPGSHKLIVSYLGYKQDTILVKLMSDQNRDIGLTQAGFVVHEVKILQSTGKKIIKNNISDIASLQMHELKGLTGMFGENDVNRNLSLLTGIHANEFSSGNIFVRGGGADQTIFQMDEAKIYNASHFGGIFSVFNPDIINSVEVYKGDMPVTAEGAISSMVNVHLKEGNNQHWRVKGSLGLMSVKALLEGPVKKNTSSVLLAFRRSYLDALLQLFKVNMEPSSTTYYFYDLNFKFNTCVNNKNRVYFSAYAGDDYLTILNNFKRSNQMMNFRWNHVYGPKLFSNTSVILSRNYMNQISNSSGPEISWERTIYSLLAKVDYSYYPSNNCRMKFGASNTITDFDTYTLSVLENDKFMLQEKGPSESLYSTGLFLSSEYDLFSGFMVSAGLRCNHIYNPNARLHTYPGNLPDPRPGTGSKDYYSTFVFDPQLSLNYVLLGNMAVKAEYKRLTNALHQLLVRDIGISTNRWMPATEGFKPQISNNYSLGWYYKTDRFSSQVEFYHRKMKNLVETLRDESVLITYTPDPYLHAATGKASGIELSTSFTISPFKTIINYTYSDAQWKTPGINQDKYYQAAHNHPHSLNVILSYKAMRRLSLSLMWAYTTGSPYTPISGKYWIDGMEMVYFDNTQINTRRLPDYQRMDISIDLAGKKNSKRRWKSYWNFSIYNLYGHKNPYSLIYFSPNTDVDNNSDAVYLDPKYLYFYQFVPSITYRFEF
jgi:outer membrane receptor protein involved in Fe transport